MFVTIFIRLVFIYFPILNVFKLVYKGCGQDNYILDANHGALSFPQLPQTFLVIS